MAERVILMFVPKQAQVNKQKFPLNNTEFVTG